MDYCTRRIIEKKKSMDSLQIHENDMLIADIIQMVINIL